MKPVIHPKIVLTHHANTDPYCGAVGPVAYENGVAWSVNTDRAVVLDWRFELKSTAHRCKECAHHVAQAIEHAKEDE